MQPRPEHSADGVDDGSAAATHHGEPEGPVPRKIDRKMLDEIFGDVLPDTTSDERGQGAGQDGYSEQWYLDNRPPHHGG